jgi:hypothetical protein
MTELLGVVLGATLAYWFGGRERRREHRRQREALATALLAELRTLEYALVRSYNDPEIGFMGGRIPTDWFEQLGESFLLFGPTTVRNTLQFRGLIRQLQACRDECGRLPIDQVTPRHHWKIRGLAGYALQLIPDLKQLLQEEGAVKPEEPDVIRVTFPDLPTIPDPSFQWRLAGPGEDDASSAAT